MDLSELTEEQKARARACQTPEEMIALAREEGYELTEADLEAVSGAGWSWCGSDCVRHDMPDSRSSWTHPY